jgi:tripartite-type tricarboxylate transporter receptor subunit TctC
MNSHKIHTSRRLLLVAAFAACTVAPPWAAAQEAAYPTRAIRFVVPYPPGGGNDDVARILAEHVSRGMGQPVIVENKAGASGMVAGEFVSRAAPDGYTIMIDHSGIVINPSLYDKTLFDVQKGLAPVAQIVTLSNFLVAHPSLPARNAHDLIALAKAQPGKINYSSPGNGAPQHIDMELFKKAAGINIVHIPYKGGAPATMAVLTNEVQVLFSGTTGLPHIRAGTLRALATTGAKRSPLLPDVPTVAEAGLPGYQSVNWMGIFAPAKTPAPIIARLNAEFTRALNLPEVKAKLQEKNIESAPTSPDVFARTIAADMALYGKVIRELGVKAD